MQTKLIFSREASHASPTALQESEKVKKMNAIYGQRCLESLNKFGHVTSWVKMFSASLIGMEGWSSMRCKLSWKLRGTKLGRMYCQLVPSTLRTAEIEFGSLLATPNTMDYMPPKSEEMTKNHPSRPGRTKSGNLREQIAYNQVMLPTVTQNNENGRREDFSPSLLMAVTGLLKTPTVMDGEVTSGKTHPISGNSGTLAQEIMSQYPPTMQKLGMLPTPQARDWKGKTTANRKSESLPDTANRIAGKTSQLNPLFVAEMMGFPPDWTVLPFLNGETKASKPTATP